MGTNNILTTAISRLDEEIDRLTEAREDLVALLQEHEIENAPRSRRSTKQEDTKSTKRTSTKASTKAKATSTAKKATRKSSDEGQVTRREEIMELLDEGLSPREIADELGIQPNYVYHVKRDWNELIAA